MTFKIGIKYGYPRIPTNLRYYAQLTKPYTVFSAFLFMFLLSLYARLGITEGILVSLAVAISHAFGQVVNQVEDVEIDRINKPYRPIPSGKITVDQAWRYALILEVLSLVFVINKPVYFFWVIVLNLLGFFYSAEPIRAKKYLWAIVWMAISRGLIPVIMILGWNPLALVTFVWVLAYQVTKDIGDEKGDAQFNVKTIPNTFGIRKTYFYMYIMLIVYSILVVHFYPILIPTILIGLIIPPLTRYPSLTDNNLGWNVYYAGLFIIVSLITITVF